MLSNKTKRILKKAFFKSIEDDYKDWECRNEYIEEYDFMKYMSPYNKGISFIYYTSSKTIHIKMISHKEVVIKASIIDRIRLLLTLRKIRYIEDSIFEKNVRIFLKNEELNK